MITLYTWTTPNGRKASIMLEETGLSYAAVPVDIGQDQQFTPEFLALSPNNKIPAIVDEEGVDRRQTVFETAAILTYLAEKTGRFLPTHGPRRAETLEWLAWSVSGLGPMLGQWNYFARRAPEPVPAAIARFTAEVARLFGVLERRLAQHGPYLAGDYSIADISTYTWTGAVLHAFQTHSPDALGPTPHIERWLSEISARPAVQRGMKVPDV
jgi:GSH-dependent disulfide-bond oxidoreductase